MHFGKIIALMTVIPLLFYQVNNSLFDKERRTRVLLFTADWCVFCKKNLKELRPELEKSGWKIGEENYNHLQLIDYDTHPDLVEKYKIKVLPTYIYLYKYKEKRRVETTITKTQFWQLIE